MHDGPHSIHIILWRSVYKWVVWSTFFFIFIFYFHFYLTTLTCALVDVGLSPLRWPAHRFLQGRLEPFSGPQVPYGCLKPPRCSRNEWKCVMWIQSTPITTDPVNPEKNVRCSRSMQNPTPPPRGGEGEEGGYMSAEVGTLTGIAYTYYRRFVLSTRLQHLRKV